MLPAEVRDSSLVGIIDDGEDRRTVVRSLGGYVSLIFQTRHRSTRIDPSEYWKTTSGCDFVDSNEDYVKALREAKAARDEERAKTAQSAARPR